MSWLISPENVKRKQANEKIIVLDVRSCLTNPDVGKVEYVQGHIPGAFFLHLEEDLSGEVEQHGGKHPLPNIDKFAKKLGACGVTTDAQVVVYDSHNDMFAPRAWWLLRYVGIDNVFVLDGGFAAWKAEGYEVTTEIPVTKQSHFVPNISQNATVSMEEVRDRDRTRTVLIDSRSYERFIGKVEPLYQKAGHIPGAVNYFWENVLDEAGNWKQIAALKKHFAALTEAEEIIVSCGSGISACPNILALQMAGFKNVKLYPGSFSDWISYEENEVATIEED